MANKISSRDHSPRASSNEDHTSLNITDNSTFINNVVSVADGSNQSKIIANGSISTNNNGIITKVFSDQDKTEQGSFISADKSNNVCNTQNNGLNKSSCQIDDVFVDEGSKNRNEMTTKISKCRQGVILVTAASCFSIISFQVGAFGAFYVILTQYFNVSKLTAGWVGSIQFGMANAGGK